MRLSVFIGGVFLIVFMAAWLPFSYFSTVFGWRSSTVWILSTSLFLMSMLYVVGYQYGKRTGNFQLKWMGSIALGSISMGVPIGLFGFLSLWAGVDGVWGGIALVFLWLLMVVSALVLEAQPPKITRLTLNLNCKTPLHIVQLTDVHINGMKSVAQVEEWVRKVNQLKPDVIVFTGDLLDVPPQRCQDQLRVLSTLKAKYAKLAVSGNHDFYVPTFQYPKVLKELGFEYIDNQVKKIQNVWFVGLPDKAGIQHGIFRQPLPALLQPASEPIVLLDHRPDAFKASAKEGISLQLSGHTHWGQIPPWGTLVRLRYPQYGVGLRRHKKALIYTSKGTSVWGPPMRFWGRSEIVSIRLV